MTAAAWLSGLCVGVMGFAIQRGGTCTVAAVEEILSVGRGRRLAAMLEASLWVAGGLLLARWQGWAGDTPPGFAVSVWTVAGGALLGLGAWLNRACVFGAVARLGSGEWAYAATPLGFFFGCATVMPLFATPAEPLAAAGPPLLAVAGLLAPLFILFVLWRMGPALFAAGKAQPWRTRLRGLESPHAATVLIGISFVITLLLVGRWAYTDILADLARGRATMLTLPALLLLALFGGALLGGWSSGRWQARRVTAIQVLRCLTGGVLMGWGSLLIPGSNDGLLLIGIPLLQAHAWLAFVSMGLAIAAALRFQSSLSRFSTSRRNSRHQGPTIRPKP